VCGIAGIIGAHDADRAAIDAMTTALARRGPDGEGVERFPAAVLGHRRLAIFDLSEAGRQPMVTDDGDLAVVFNGAIYNFPTLRTELEARGARFHSGTDTEVLLHGFREWGIDGLVARLRGMFAFALWDERTRRAFLVRDRLGVKPLLYARRPDGALVFGSTVPALRGAGMAGELDADAVSDLLEYGFVDESHAIYAGVRKLPPAHILEWHAGEAQLRRYWAPPAPGSTPDVTFEQAVEETERLLLQAVERRLHADVPVGALLSGGIDSALVCWAAQKLGGDLTAYTIGTPGHVADETASAVATAREIGIAHVVREMTAVDADVLEELVGAYGEPFASASAMGMLRVSQVVRESATVLLTGDGGDDVFLGYPRHRILRKVERVAQRLPGAAGPAWRAVRNLVPAHGALKRARSLGDYTTGGLGAFLSATPGLPALRRLGILGERLLDHQVPARAIPWSVSGARGALGAYLAHDLEHQFVAEYMTKVDGATMYWALEARAPFLDQELWEFAAGLTYDVRLHRGELKAILRELVRRHVSPRAASERKRGFIIPVESWVRGHWRPMAEEVFAQSRLAAGGWLRRDALLAALRDPHLTEDVARQLWYVLVTELWLRRQADHTLPLLAAPVAGVVRA
jgi:asparagine synthase (glutamine-hydrolysing)